MAFCTKCGNEFPESGRFCDKCGVERASSPAAPAAKKRLPRWARLCIGWGILGLAGLTILGALLPADSKQVKTSPPPPVTLEYELAVIDSGSGIAIDDPRIAHYRDALNALASVYSGGRQRIADQTVKAKQILKSKGVDESALNIMQGLAQIFSTRNQDQKYADVLAMYVTMRDDGESHAAAVDGVHEAVRALENMAAGKSNATDASSQLPEGDPAQPLTYICAAIPGEDSDNGGIRADGKPWDLTDLAVDSANAYNTFGLSGKSDLPHAARVLYDALRQSPPTETIAAMCTALGRHISSPNPNANLTVASAAEALQQSIRLSPVP